jgi:hypothetical protein
MLESRAGQYLAYAAGEVVLVIIGILIELTNVASRVGQIGPRVEHEVPDAIGMARELVDLLMEEYPE